MKSTQTAYKIIKVTISESKKLVCDAIDRLAAQRTIDKKIQAGLMIADALQNESSYQDGLLNPATEKGEEIVIKVSPKQKEHFIKSAKLAQRTQAQHASFLLEKWCEKNQQTA